MKNKDAIKILKTQRKALIDHVLDMSYPYESHSILVALDLAIKALENQPQWIPVKTRKMTAEEIEELSKLNDLIDADDIDQWCYCCQLPDHAQEVMITTKYGIASTTFYDDNYGAYFEDYEDRDDVLAWMPLPKPYTKEDDT